MLVVMLMQHLILILSPFLGSGALFLKLEPEKWVINDLNKDCVNVWRNVRDNPEEIIDAFKKFGKKFKQMSKILDKRGRLTCSFECP